MQIKKAQLKDIDEIYSILRSGSEFLHECGVEQWINGYPTRDIVENDVANQNCYIIEDNGEILCVFTAIYGADSTYALIEDGAWLLDTDNYITVHRIATHKEHRGKGLAGIAYKYAEELCKGINALSLRIDTHKDNKANLSAIEKYGFTYCGIIYTDDGSPRVAYEKIIEREN